MHVAYRLSARILGASAAASATLALSHAAFAFSVSDTGLDATARAAGIRGGADLPTIVGSLVGAALTFIGVLFMLLMIYGGFLWMNARGNDAQVEKAKNLITAAVIGMVIIGSGYAITQFVLSNVITATGTGGSAGTSGSSGGSDSSDDDSGGGSGSSGGSGACRSADDCGATQDCVGGRCVDRSGAGAPATPPATPPPAAAACVASPNPASRTCPAGTSWTSATSNCCPDAAAAPPGAAPAACVASPNPAARTCPAGTHWTTASSNCCPD